MASTRISVALVFGLLALTGCGSGVCTEGRACPTACERSEDCAAGETCTEGTCGQPVATASAYWACALDADCPRGDHCSLGACTHQCLTDSGCPTGTVCSDRGRCAPDGSITVVAPPAGPVPTKIEVSQTRLDFGPGVTQQTVELSNSSGRPIEFRVLSESNWLNVEPASGSFSTPTQLLTVTVDPTGGDTNRHSAFAINTSAGHRKVGVTRTLEPEGHYAGEVRWTFPYELADSGLELHLFRGAATGALGGYVSNTESPLFPAKAGVIGTFNPDGEVTLGFEVVAPPGTDGNPRLTNGIRRALTLHGRMDANGDLVGTMTERIAGLHFEAGGVELSGEFHLARVGKPIEGQASAPPDVTPVAPSSPFTESQLASCRRFCPSAQTDACKDDLNRAQAYLHESTQLYRTFQANVEANGRNPYTESEAQACSSNVCVNETNLRCAQALFISYLEANPQDASAAAGLLDSLEVVADTSIFLGNGRLVAAFDAWKSTSSILDELPMLQSAMGHFAFGSHARSALQPLGMLDAFTLGVIHRQVPASLLRNSPSAVRTHLGDQATRSEYEHLRRQALAVAGAMRAGAELAERLHRLGRLEDAITTARRAALQGYLDSAALGQLFAKAGVESEPEISVLRDELSRLVRRSEDLRSGRNPAGYLASYVPLLYAGPLTHRSNLLNILEATNSIEVRGAAESAEASADQLGREFEASTSQFESQRLQLASQHQAQLLDLCGALDLKSCGLRQGQIFNSISELKQAHLRFKSIQQRISDIHTEIAIENSRLAAQTGLIDAEIEAIREDGRRTSALDEQRQYVNRVNAGAAIMDGFVSAVVSGGTNVSGLVSSAASAFTSEVSFDIEKEQAELEQAKKIRFESNTRASMSIDSAALVATKRLETHTLLIEAASAQEGVLQASANIRNLHLRAQLLNSTRAFESQLDANNAYRSLQLRTYVDSLGAKARDATQRYLRWAYLSTRALEYELNVSYDSAPLWRARSASEVSAYLSDLVEFYRIGNSLPPEQVIADVVSLRDVLVDLRTPVSDVVTGRVYSQRERFRHYVSQPENRDRHGNLRLTFMTHRPDKVIFSKAVCSDRIQSIRINLIGDNLGAGVSNAYVRLSQGGTSFLRTCDSGGATLTPYSLLGPQQEPRVARIQAGVNAPNRGLELAPNTDHLHTALLAGPWELIVDQRSDVEPSNAALDLSQLDDIELVIEHKAYTLQ